jgi:two-component system cell cycle response regulator
MQPTQRVDDDTTRLGSLDDAVLRNESGAAQKASLIVLAGWEIGREIELHGKEHTIGRAPTSDTCINQPSISRSHAAILLVSDEDGEHFEVRDLDSRNGVLVNNVRVKSARLGNGDKVLLGDVLMKFTLHDSADANFYREVHRLIHFEQLTGLLTMDSFRRYLDQELARVRGTGTKFCLAMTDLDGLKKVNDTHGHLAGRKVVKEMGAIIRASLRGNDKSGLYGGDETIILYPETSVREAELVAERLRKAIESTQFEHQGAQFRVTISQGLAEWPTHGNSVEQIIEAADGALYAAKAAGRNCVKVAGE